MPFWYTKKLVFYFDSYKYKGKYLCWMLVRREKCVGYLTNEMSKTERSVFEIELFRFRFTQHLWKLQNNIRSYPNSELPKKTVSFEDLINRSNKPQASIKKSSIRKISVLLPFSCWHRVTFYWVPHSNYTNHRIAGKAKDLVSFCQIAVPYF
jgi:hypothetical protein